MGSFHDNHHSIAKDTDEYKENVTILWCDFNINGYIDIEQIKNLLQRITTSLIFHTELEQCLNFIQSIDKENIFLVISGLDTIEFLPQISKFHQIKAIFILCTDTTKYEHLKITNSKIIDIYTKLDFLCASIHKKINSTDNQLLTFNIFNQNQTSKESAQFIWSQLFTQIILQSSNDYHVTKQQMIDMYRQYYRDNLKKQKLINQFEQEYQSEQAIRWYLNKSFIFKYITKALKTQDIDLLYIFRFFIEDLTKNVADEHQKILLSNEKILIVYHGTKLTKKQLKKFRKNQNALISMNEYLIANRLYSLAFSAAMKPTKRTNVVPVLFEIECNIQEHGHTTSFADIAQYSDYPHEEEVLFDINITFRLKSIQQHSHIWLIKLNVSNDGQEILKDYLKKKYNESEEKSMRIVFGRLMCSLGQYNKAQKYFERLLSDVNGEDIAWIEFNLGRTFDFKNEWKIAQEYYNRAYERMVDTKPIRWQEAAYMLNKLGTISYEYGHNIKALDYYQRVLKIKQNFNYSDHIDNVRILNNIAFILNTQGHFTEAFNYYEHALRILKTFYTTDRIDIARNLNNIGNILYQIGKYDNAADHYQEALKIQQSLYPNNLMDIACILNSIGLILNIQGKYNDALDFCQHALELQQNLYPPDHIDLAGTLNNIGVILYNRGKYNQALYYYQRAFEIRKKYYAFDHIDIARSLNNIGNILYQQNKYDETLNYYLQALTIQENFYLSDHVDIALNLNNIGCVLDRLGKYDEAIYYYQNALKIQKKLYISDHPDIAFTLDHIGTILYQEEKYKEALEYYQQGLKIREKMYPFGHVDIGDSLNNIGMIYQCIHKSDISLNYFQQSLILYEKFLPSKHPNIEIVRRNINRITMKKNIEYF
ncbi:unnamed protein product [Adineta steineri]|uniref:Uncharacterized protein n=1 Tax=Adineta steineri TaxID=433720 RepID=A0A813WQP6_9BILA|nr:unnamed protein product [Adineta steineri]CAF3676926.1 unnamed protein product [Adineta steineri]